MSKRYEPLMHTAEHVLNQTMDRIFNCGRCFSAHINKKKSKCDYRFDRNLTPQEVQALQNKVNEQLARNLPVTEEYIPRDEAQKIFSLERLPESAGDTIRIVRVGDYDACPCIGEHAGNTSEIGIFTVISNDYTDSVLRLRFKLLESARQD